MHLLPLLLGVAVAVVIAPATLASLAESRLAQENYRGVVLPFPAGTAIIAAVALALGPLGVVQQLDIADVLRPQVGPVALYVLGVAALGLVDDALGAAPRGWRGHGAALLKGGLSTGALKAAGALGLALYTLAGRYDGAGRYLLAVLVLILATNLFNLLDLRPGRSAKAFVLLGIGLTLGAWDTLALEALGVFIGPVLVLGLLDLRERAMLGDTGSNLIGGLAGWWLLLTLSTTGLAVAAGVLLAITIFGEFRSISSTIEGNPLLRQLDSLGRTE